MLSTRCTITVILGLLSASLVGGCRNTIDETPTTPGTPVTPNPPIQLVNQSINPALVRALAGFENLQITTLISSDDKLPQSPDFVFGAQPDGAAMLKDPNSDGYILINNHEVLRSVSRVYLDKTLKPVKGEYIVDGEGGVWRLCSATLATPREHGFGPVFLTAGESGPESMVHAINPLGAADKKNKDRILPALGKASMENAVPLPKEAFPGKTVIIIGEDYGDGQLLAYVADRVGDLETGRLYFLRRKNQDPVETNMAVGQTYEVEFVEVDQVRSSTGEQIAQQAVDKQAISFARVEDVDYRKGGNAASREVYFSVTGVAQSDGITPVTGKTMWGRVYRLVLDAGNPLSGRLTPLIDGGIDPGNSIINPDNICVTSNFVYIQEDGDTGHRNVKHDGRIWQWSIQASQLKPMLEMHHRRDDPAFNAKYNPLNNLALSTWEYGAMYDISDLIGLPNTFAINLHPHTWLDDKYLNADGSGLSDNKEGGQVIIVRGIPR